MNHNHTENTSRGNGEVRPYRARNENLPLPSLFINPEPMYYYAMSCVDIARNRKLGYGGQYIVTCNANEHFPTQRCNIIHLPRFIVRGRYTPSEGIWCNIVFDRRVVLTLCINSVSDIFDFEQYVCMKCSMIAENCNCTYQSDSEDTVLADIRLVDVFTNPVHTDDALFHLLTKRRNTLYMDRRIASSTSMTLQSKKEYVDILSEPGKYEPVLKLFEDVVALFYQVRRAENWQDFSVATGVFMRSVTGRSNVMFAIDMVQKSIDDLKEAFQLQSGNHWIDTLDDIYKNWSRAKRSTIGKKIKKAFTHIVAHAIYAKLGIEVDAKLFKQLTKEQIEPTMLDYVSFSDAMIGLTIFCLKQGRQCVLRGSIEPMFIDSTTASDWIIKVKDLKMKSEFLGNPAAINMNVHDYLGSVEQSILESESIFKMLETQSPEWKMVLTLKNDLNALYNRYVSVDAAQSVRRQPLGVVLYGLPGIGKTALEDMLFYFDAMRRGRPVDKKFKYNFCSEDEYMSGYKTSMHTVVIDDAAQHSPSKIQGVDPTVSMIIRIVNNNPWCPPQAAVEDKGKTPMMPDLCIVSTNVLDMRLPVYYPKSYAPMRRLKVHIEPIVKPRYRKEGNMSIDPTKVDYNERYPDYWDFIIREPRLVDPDNMVGEFVEIGRFDRTSDLLDWFGKVSDTHHKEQVAFIDNLNRHVNDLLCGSCKLPLQICTCAILPQIDEDVQSLRFRGDGTPYYVPDRESPRQDLFEIFTPQVEHIPSPLFDRDPTDYSRPWRKEIFRGPQRAYILQLSYRFVKKFESQYMKKFVDDYGYNELPPLMGLGWTDEQIRQDFSDYMEYQAEHSQGELLDFLTEYSSEEFLKQQTHIKKDSWADRLFKFLVSCYFSYKLVRKTARYFGRFYFVRRSFLKWFRPCLVRTDNQKHIMKEIGKSIDGTLQGQSPLMQILIQGLLATSALTVLVSMYMNMKGTMRKNEQTMKYLAEDVVASTTAVDKRLDIIEENLPKPEPVQSLQEKIECLTMGEEDHDAPKYIETSELQVLTEFGSLPKPMPGDAKTNVWIDRERTVTSIDFVPKRIMQLNALDKILCRNTLRFTLMATDYGGKFKTQGHLIILSENTFLTNNHALPTNGKFLMEVYFDRAVPLGPNVSFEIDQKQIRRLVNRDIAIVQTESLPCVGMDFSKNLVHNSFDGTFNGYLLVKGEDGLPVRKPMIASHRVHFRREMVDLPFDLEAFASCIQGDNVTVNGDCGAPLVLETGHGPVVVGFHMALLGNTTAYSSFFTYEDYKELVGSFGAQGGEIPVSAKRLVEAPRSYIDYHPHGSIFYHGELLGFRSRPKHHVFETEFAETLYGKEVCGHKIERRLTGPVMDSWRPQQVSLSEFLQPVAFMDEVILEEVYDAFYDHVIANLPDGELELMHTYTVEVAINGMPGMAYVDPLKRSTSMGFPWKTTKRKFLIPLDDPRWSDGVTFTPEIMEEIDRFLELMRQGIRTHGIFSANLKDEPVSFKKLLNWKTRVFFSGPVPLLVIVRMFYGGFCRVVMRNRFVFFSAVGMNCHSPEWEQLYQFLSKFGTEHCIAGDYAFFDKKMKLCFLKHGMKFIIRLCQASGNFTDEEILIMKVIMHDITNPTVDYFGMLVTFLGGEVSGHQLTTILNCILNIGYLCYCFVKLYPGKAKEFFKWVRAITLGDDHVLCVHPDYHLFSHTAIQGIMRSLGVDYTMADKTSESVPFISLDEAVFLKRKFKYDVEFAMHVAPLDVESIFKMVTVQVESKACTKQEQLAQAIVSASMESFFHGETFFAQFNELIDSLIKSDELVIYMEKYPRFTWGQNVARFWNTDVQNAAIETGRSQKLEDESNYCSEQTLVLQSSERVDPHLNSARALPEVRIYECSRLTTLQDYKGVVDDPPPPPDNYRISQNEEISSVSAAQNAVKEESVEQTTFVNETVIDSNDLSAPLDRVPDSHVLDAQLASFLKRPARIFTYTWSENAAAGTLTNFYPWALYLSITAIKNKLYTFGLMRGKLHLKFTVNASPFYYGSLGAFFTPLPVSRPDTTGLELSNYGQINMSQKPHVWIEPQKGSTCEMVLPFVYHKDFVNTTSTSDVNDLGIIELVQYAALRSANGVTTSGATIVVYAWMEDLELTGPTTSVVLQSSKEYVGNGQISGPASTVANVASKLTDAPIIGGFAKATEVVAGSVSKVASYFGYTNVPNVSDVQPFKSLPFHTLASGHISEPINKLSLQPKQEIAISNSYTGDSQDDDLMISKFAGRESFLCGTLWTTTATTNTILFTSAVTPALCAMGSSPTFYVYSTPMHYISQLFNYWRGDIIFRFKVIRSQYHRGRLNICWDSQSRTLGSMPSVGDPSVMNIVFDLEDSDEVEVRVPYMQAAAFLPFNSWVSGDAGVYWSNGTSPSSGTTNANGTLQVRVVNRLTAPEDTSDVDLLVFVRAAENIEFAGPTTPVGSSTLRLQSNKSYVELNGKTDSNSDAYNEMFGEKIVSLREVLHRSSRCDTRVLTPATGTQLFSINRFQLQRLPRPRGYHIYGLESTKGVVTTTTSYPCNFTRTVPISWVTACFIGYKGSTNYHINVMNTVGGNTNNVASISVCRMTHQSKGNLVSIDPTASTSLVQSQWNHRDNGLEVGSGGLALTNQNTQSGLSVNLPYYVPYKFIPYDPTTLYSTQNPLTGLNPERMDKFELEVLTTRLSTTTNQYLLADLFVGSGPDFNLVFFINVPIWTNNFPGVAT